MERKIKVVQFTHPGGEHRPTRRSCDGDIMRWSTGHGRKFMTAKGLTADKVSELRNLQFWGEWEPMSKIVCRFNTNVADRELPTCLQQPFFPDDITAIDANGVASYDCDCPTTSCDGKNTIGAKNEKRESRLNTDPLVFGDCFLYSLCKQVQRKGTRATPTTNLERGSIVLFGSTKGKRFVVDTVFVVADYKEFHPHTCRKDLSGFVSEEYFRIMGFEGLKENYLHTCYKGATIHNPVEGMYSFVPCHADAQAQPFARPHLLADNFKDLGDVIRNNLNSSSHSILVTQAEANAIWQRVREVIHEQGCKEGVHLLYETKI